MRNEAPEEDSLNHQTDAFLAELMPPESVSLIFSVVLTNFL